MKRILFSIVCISLISVAFAEASVSDKNAQLIQAAKDGNLPAVQTALAEEKTQLPLALELKEFSSGRMETNEYAGVVVALLAKDTCKADIEKQATFALSKDGTKYHVDYIHMVSSENTSASASGLACMTGVEFTLGDKTYKCYSPFASQAIQLIDPDSALHISFEKWAKVELVFLFKADPKTITTVTILGKELTTAAPAKAAKDGNLPIGQTPEAQVTNPSQQRMDVLSDKKLCTMKAGAIRESFKVSPDLSRVVYVVGERGKRYVMINDDKNQEFEGIGGLILSPDGNRIVYGAHSDKGWHVVLDGKASEQFYDAVGGFTFSPDSRRLAYIALKQGKTVVIVDGRELDSYRVVRQPVFSPDSKWVAYIAIDEEGKHLVGVDGRRGKGYSAIGGDTPKFSPHGSRPAYIAVEDNKFFIVVDGEDGERFDGIGTSFGEFIWFTSDGKHFAYVGKNNVRGKEESYLVLDKKVQSRYEAIYWCTFSPRDDRLAYAGKTKDGVYLILDGNRSDLKFDDILRIQWKPDGSGIALVAQSNGKHRVVIDKEEQRDYDSIYDNRVVFSQDGKRYAYVGVRGKSWHIVVDGKETGVYPGLGAPVSFSSDGKHFAYGALIEYDMERVQALEIVRLAGMGDWDKIIGRGEQKMVLIIDDTIGAVHDGFLTSGGATPTWNNDNALRYLYISQQVNIQSTLVRLE